MLSATEIWSQKETTQELATWGGAKYFSVVGTTAELLNDYAVLNANGIPAKGASHPANRDLRVGNKTVGPGLTERVVTVRYQWMPAWDPKQQTDDPLRRAPEVTWGTGFVTEPWLFDAYGNPISNSALDALANSPQKEKFFKILRITRWERNYNIKLARDFEGKINSVDLVAGDVRFLARTVKCTAIAPAESYLAGAFPLKIAYDFQLFSTAPTAAGNRILPVEVARDPYRHWVLDTGLRGYSGAGGANPGDFKLATDGSTVTQEIPLNGYGAPMEPSKYRVNGATPTNNPNPPPITVARAKLSGGKAIALGYEICDQTDLRKLGL